MRRNESADVVGGKYSLISELGHGGMGTVWRAYHLSLECPIALKLINPAIAIDPHAVQRFLREARMAAALRSLHVVQILDYGLDGDTPYIAMEMLDGESLAERLERDGPLSPPETARVVRHVSRALTRAHDAGIVHRDLKPENIFIVKNDDDTVIKVLDFGIAKTMTTRFDTSKASMKTRTGAVMGTPYFMSPEQANGEVAVDFRADLWALGVIAFECLLGKLPFSGDNITRITLAICSDPLPVPSEIGAVPIGFDEWFARACAREPAARFNSAKDAADAFDQLECGAAPGPSSQRQPEPSPSIAAAEAPLYVKVKASQLRVQLTIRADQRRTLLKTAAVGLAGSLIAGGAIGLGAGWFQEPALAPPGQVLHELSPTPKPQPGPTLTIEPEDEAPAINHRAVLEKSLTSQQPAAVKAAPPYPRVDARRRPATPPKQMTDGTNRKKRARQRAASGQSPAGRSFKVPSVDDLGI